MKDLIQKRAQQYDELRRHWDDWLDKAATTAQSHGVDLTSTLREKTLEPREISEQKVWNIINSEKPTEAFTCPSIPDTKDVSSQHLLGNNLKLVI